MLSIARKRPNLAVRQQTDVVASPEERANRRPESASSVRPKDSHAGMPLLEGLLSRRQSALVPCRSPGELKLGEIVEIRALSHRLTTRSSMRANEYLSLYLSEEGKRRTYARTQEPA